MHKKILFLLTGLIALSISAIPALASDPPTDDGQYIWQDEKGDYWYRNGSEDEYIGEGNYAPDPDSGELMEGNDAGWTEQDGYFEPHYYYEDGSVWLEDATGTTYIGSRDKYYIDDYGNLQEYSESEAASSSGETPAGSAWAGVAFPTCPVGAGPAALPDTGFLTDFTPSTMIPTAAMAASRSTRYLGSRG